MWLRNTVFENREMQLEIELQFSRYLLGSRFYFTYKIIFIYRMNSFTNPCRVKIMSLCETFLIERREKNAVHLFSLHFRTCRLDTYTLPNLNKAHALHGACTDSCQI